MFNDAGHVDYKLQGKFDFKFGADVEVIEEMGVRCATRQPHQLKIEENFFMANKDLLSENEVRRERIWADFSKNLMRCGQSPRSFLQ
jgi:hypothetical protein